MPSFGSLGLAAIIAAIAGFWQQFKSFCSNIFSWGVVSISFESHHENGLDLMNFLLEKSKIIKYGHKNFRTLFQIHKKTDYGVNLWSDNPKGYILVYNHRPLIVKVEGEKTKISFFRKTFDYNGVLNQIIQNRLEEYKRNDIACKKERIGYHEVIVETFYKQGDDLKIIGAQANSPVYSEKDGESPKVDTLTYNKLKKLIETPGINKIDYADYFNPRNKDQSFFYFSKEHLELKKNIEFWLDNRTWFSERGIKYTRKSLLIGPAGGGKSQGVIEIAKLLKLRVHTLFMSAATNERLKNKLDDFRNSIILIEDVDSIWDGRKNISDSSSSKDKLSFDFFLNCLSGANAIDNCFIIMTTNHPEKLDPALIRDGRVDLKLEFGPLDEIGRFHIARKILSDWPAIIEEIVIKGEGMVGAAFENLCVTKAINLKWSELN